MELGERFKPGDGPAHFCQPTSVAISAGDIFISDGLLLPLVLHSSYTHTHIPSYSHSHTQTCICVWVLVFYTSVIY